MRNAVNKLVAGMAVMVLMSAVSAQAAFLEDFEGGTSGQLLTSAPYNWTVLYGDGSATVRYGDEMYAAWPHSLAAVGGGSWGNWHGYGKPVGFAAPSGSLTEFSADANTRDPNGTVSSHWGMFGAYKYSSPSGLIGVTWMANYTAATPGWMFDARYVGGGGYEIVPGFLGEAVQLKIFVDRTINQVWGTVSNGTTTVTTAQYPIVQNADIDAVALFWGNYGDGRPISGSYAYGMYTDNIRAWVVPEPMTLVLLGVGGMFLRRRR